jgi:endonuclease YncB( thermonuclease family)
MDYIDEMIEKAKREEEVAGADEAAGDRVLDAIRRVRERRAGVNAQEAYQRMLSGDLQRVVDADTVDLSKGKLRQRVRFAGIDAPELGQGELGMEARAFLDELVKDQKTLRRGSRIQDRRGRDVSIVFAGDKNLNVELVRGGYAKVYRDYLNDIPDAMVNELLAAEEEAKGKQVGVWAPGYVDAAEWRKTQQEKDLSVYDREVKDPETVTVEDVIDRVRKRRGLPSFREELASDGPSVYGIKRSEKYVPEEGWLERALGALDYAGNASRSFMKGAGEGGYEKGWQYLKEAAAKKRHTSPESLRDAATERAGLGKIRLGKDDDNFDVGDLGDFALDVGTDVFTDPLTLVGGVFSAAVKGGKKARAVAKGLVEGAQDAKVGVASEAARRYGLVKGTASAGIGAVYGVGTVDGDAGLEAKLAAALGGAAVGVGSGKALEKVGTTARALADKGSDWYAVKTRGSRFKDFSQARAVALAAYDRAKNIAEWVKQGRQEALDGLTDAERLKVTDYLERAKTEIIRRRHKAEQRITGAPGSANYNRQFNSMMKKINYDVETSFVPAMLKNEEDNIVGAIGKMAKHNEAVIKRLNLALFGIEEADSSLRNVGKSYTKGSFVKDPGDGRFYKGRDWYGSNKYSVEAMEDLKEMGLVRLDFGMFAGKDIVLKDGGKIPKGTKITDFDFKQVKQADGSMHYEKMILQDGTVLGRDDVYLLAKNFQPYDPKNFKGGKGVVGLRYHIDDVFKRKDFEGVEDALKEVQIEKAESLERSKAAFKIAQDKFEKETGRKVTAIDGAGLSEMEAKRWQELMAESRDTTYAAYAERWAKKYLDEHERSAIKLMADYKNAPVSKGVKGLETFLSGYDRMSNFVKASLLYTSMSWLKNNMWDNLTKAYVEHGLAGVMDTGTFGKLQKGLYQDVRDLYANRLNRKYLNDHMGELVEEGVLDNPMYKSMMDEQTREYFFSPKKIAESQLKGVNGLFEKAGRLLLHNPYSKKVANLGSVMEGTARAVTYLRTKEALAKMPRFKNGTKEDFATIRRIAADMTKRTFFDYSDVTHLEGAILKRLFPFYSFYSKNLPYWLRATFDPEKVHRIVALEKTRRNIGEDPSKYEKSGMTRYIADQAPRSFGKDRKGNRVYGVMPSLSQHDSIRMMNPLDVGKQIVEKGHPFGKWAYEMATGEDLFDGQKLLPSESPQGKKFLYSRGHKLRMFPQLEVDANGNPYTRSDWLVVFERTLSTVWPHGIIDQVAGSVGKVASGKEGFLEAISNRVSPVETIKVSPAFERMVRLGKRRGEDGK